MKSEALYRASSGPLFRLLRTPTEAPEAPAGSHESVLVMRASPKFLKYRLVLVGLGASIAALVGCGFLIAAAVSGEPEWLALGAAVLVLDAVISVLSWFVIRIEYQLRYYILTDRSLRVRSGAVIVREQTLTYANVQNLDLKQGPIQRWLGIADLHVETAGGGSSSSGNNHERNLHEAVIAGVENAREIREQIRARLGTQTDAGLGDPDDKRSARRTSFDSPQTLAALRELANEARGLRAAAEAAS